MQADILDGGPDNRQTTALCREDIDLIGPLPHIAEQTFNGIGGPDMPMHPLRKVVKREGFFFFLCQTAHGFWIALALFGFAGHELDHGLLFCRLVPDAHEFGLDHATLAARNSVEDVALLMQQTTLRRGSRKQFLHGCQQSVMPVAHDQIHLSGSSGPQVVQEAHPSLFVLLSAGA